MRFLTWRLITVDIPSECFGWRKFRLLCPTKRYFGIIRIDVSLDIRHVRLDDVLLVRTVAGTRDLTRMAGIDLLNLSGHWSKLSVTVK